MAAKIFSTTTLMRISLKTKQKKIFKSVLRGLSFLHGKFTRICHRDLSLENILIKEVENRDGTVSYKILLFDFGLSVRWPFSGFNNRATLSPVLDMVGKVFLYCPEIVSQSEYEGISLDMWVFGLVLFQFLTKYHLFRQNLVINDDFYEVVAISHRLSDVIRIYGFVDLSTNVVDLMQSVLKDEKWERKTADELLRHAWFN
mmetsp:Transcript_14798/g.22036  ORF Transcript_14798/g.22036 Transcript_14798/m.22036 type:complete len:201 (+) Transcript_14798:192-794(+)